MFDRDYIPCCVRLLPQVRSEYVFTVRNWRSTPSTMRVLFVVRSSADFERFVAIASHLCNEALTFVTPDLTTHLGGDIHRRMFESLGLRCEWLGTVQEPARAEHLSAVFNSVRPDIVVVDQFGPTCAPAVVAMRDMALALGVPTCMIPHGVRVVDRREPHTSVPHLGKIADVIFYTSEEHFARAGAVLSAPGSQYAILGDPRLDRAHIARLRAFGAEAAPRGVTAGRGTHLAFFGARLEPALLAAVGRCHPIADSNELNLRMLRILDASGAFRRLTAKPHPRLGRWENGGESAVRWSSECCDSLTLITVADVVATPVSSVALEGLVLGKRVLVLDFRRVAPEYRSIFEELPCAPVSRDGMLELVEVPADAAFLARHCWGGDCGWTVARKYADTLRAVARGQGGGVLQTM
jgi:hypothetical protein